MEYGPFEIWVGHIKFVDNWIKFLKVHDKCFYPKRTWIKNWFEEHNSKYSLKIIVGSLMKFQKGEKTYKDS